MSLRQMKKLQGATQVAPEKIDVKDKEDQDEQEEEQEKPKAQKLKNAFEMFQMDNDEEEDEDEEQSNGNKNEEEEEESPTKEEAQKKKKKKKNKKAKKGQADTEDQEEESKKPEKDDEFDKILEEFKEESKEREVISASCLNINPRALDYNKEMAKYFKNAKLTTKDKDEGRNNREKGILKQMKNNRNAKNFKNYKLVYTDTTHMFNPERFSCEMIGHNSHKMRIFALKPTKKYQDLQEAYESLKNTYDPNNIAEFVRQNPYHTDALYDVAELLRMQGDYKQTNQFLENIIFMYEDSFGYEFNIFEEDDVMLSFDENEYSRTLFVALNRFMDVLGKKGCYRSAFEYNKVLVKLNPYQDPVGGLLSLDYNAISSQNYDFLLDFPHKYGKQYYKSPEYSLIYLPNYLYSCALAKLLKIIANEDVGMSQYAAVTEEDFNKAKRTDIDPVQENHNVMLIHAILLFPKAIRELIEANEYAKQSVALGGDMFTDWQKKSYKDILGHKIWEQGKHEYIYPCLNVNNNEDIEGIAKVIEIYIERSKILWKNNKVILWVKACLGMIINQIEKGFNYEEFIEGLYTAEFKYKIPFEFSRYKGLHRANFSDRVERIDFNNIPDNPGQGRNRERPGYNPINPDQGLMGLIFGSLLPWNHIHRDGNQNNRRNGPHDPDDVEIEEEEF